MTPTFGDLRAWRGFGVELAASQVRVVEADVARARASFHASIVAAGAWSGPAAAEATARHTELEALLTGSVTGLGAMAAALDSAASAVSAVERLVAEVDASAARAGVVVCGDGRLVPVSAMDVSGSGAARDELAILVEVVMERARAVESELAQGLAAASPGVESGMRVTGLAATGWSGFELGVASPLVLVSAMALEPEPGLVAGLATMTPDERAAWWAGLSERGREAVVDAYPDGVGAADGLPGWARDRANRILLERAETRLVAEELRLRPEDEGGSRLEWEQFTGILGMAATATVDILGRRARSAAHEQVVDKLASVRAVKDVLAQPDGRVRQLLVLDVTGRLAKAAVSTGDVDRAGHVAVFVGGLSTTVDRDLGGYDRVMGQLADLASRQARSSGDGTQVAAVAWLGYEAPQVVDTVTSRHSVLLADSAKEGAPLLTGFVTGLAASRPSRVHITVVGHSYGSTVAGLALAGGLGRSSSGAPPGKPVDLVAMGSPGLGVSRVSELGLDGSRVHVLESASDPVADTGWFGPEPDHLAGVDLLATTAEPLPDGRAGGRSDGHSAYLDPGTTSQWNVAAVVAGTPQLAVRAHPCAGDIVVPTDLRCLLPRAG